MCDGLCVGYVLECVGVCGVVGWCGVWRGGCSGVGCVLGRVRGVQAVGDRKYRSPLYYPDTLVNPDTCLGIDFCPIKTDMSGNTV